jgi:hypothetical protein
MMKLPLCLQLVSVFAWAASAMSSEIALVKVLGKNDMSVAPNSTYQCWVDYTGQDRNVLTLRMDSQPTIDVWRCVKSLGVSWSPDSKYLAVEDYLDGLNTAVLVFKIDSAVRKVNLIYQTPYSNSVFSHYHILGWHNGTPGDAIVIATIDKSTGNVQSRETGQLDRRGPITQTIYPPDDK